LALHPTVYADILGRKMKEHGSQAYLVNTGWIGGGYGIGQRMDIGQTRAIITAILEGKLENAEFEELPVFGLSIPKSVPGVDSKLLNPRNTWADKQAYDDTAKKLAGMFVKNFERYADNQLGKSLKAFGPKCP